MALSEFPTEIVKKLSRMSRSSFEKRSSESWMPASAIKFGLISNLSETP